MSLLSAAQVSGRPSQVFELAESEEPESEVSESESETSCACEENGTGHDYVVTRPPTPSCTSGGRKKLLQLHNASMSCHASSKWSCATSCQQILATYRMHVYLCSTAAGEKALRKAHYAQLLGQGCTNLQRLTARLLSDSSSGQYCAYGSTTSFKHATSMEAIETVLCCSTAASVRAAAEAQSARQFLGKAPASLPRFQHEDTMAAAQPAPTGGADRALARAAQPSETEHAESQGGAGPQPSCAALPEAGEGPQEQLRPQRAACSQEQAPTAG